MFQIWYADQFERPYFFKFDKVCDPKYASKKIFQVVVTLCLLPTNFCYGGGKAKLYSYEFYHPSVAARQFGLGQLPIHIFFTYHIQSVGQIIFL
jgi:hypothetical protein